MIGSDVIRYGLLRCGLIWYGVGRYGMVRYGTVSYRPRLLTGSKWERVRTLELGQEVTGRTGDRGN